MIPQETSLHEGRIEAFVKYLPNLFFPAQRPLELTGITDPDPIPFADIGNREFRPMQEGDLWGEKWDSAWFRLRGQVPADWAGKTVVARLNFEGEGCVFSEDGEPLQGLTDGSWFDASARRERYPIADPARGGEAVDLLVETAANQLLGLERDRHPVPNQPYREEFPARVKFARLCVFEPELYQLWMDVSVLTELMLDLPEADPQRAQLRHRLTRAANGFHYDTPNPAEIRAILAPALACRADDTRLTTTAVGHAHIDTGWLWPVRETIRKCGRTFASQLRLLEKYPDYVFGASQAQHYQFTKEHYPGLYQRIQRAVAEGRWEIQGAMWVEADCNVTSGESLVRQVLHGKKFFRDEFGVDVRNLWLPDVFGYAASLPQILRQAGVDTFLTQKLSWSQFNDFPHHTFMWKGIDGTEILTHFPPEDTYNSKLKTDRLRYGLSNFKERGFLPEFITVFGIGDGGGGPREEELEHALRQQDLAGCPRLKFGAAQPMLDRLHEYEDELDDWSGELYLEFHRGTLTTQAKVKRMNRKLELQLRRTEMLWSCLELENYPHEALDALWKKVLINQFHDIIPGSSIREVYQDAHRDYADVEEELSRLEQDAVRQLAQGSADRLTFFNPLSHEIGVAVDLPAHDGGTLVLDDGSEVEIQAVPGGGGRAWVDLGPLQTVAGSVSEASRGKAGQSAVQASPECLENDLIRYEFDSNGQVSGVYDKEIDCQVMREGESGNVLSLYEDWPLKHDAWDIDISYRDQLRETARLISVETIGQGPAYGAVAFRFEIGASVIDQEVRLGAGSRRLDFVTRVNWAESRKMLRVAFPVDISSQEATYEIQYGTYKRPTHSNTSWDMAKFEVCGHRFADLSEPGYGVALLNDCKYGYRVQDNVLDLNLLRAPFFPDRTADRGEHIFTYSLYPHPGTFEESDVQAQAHVLNQPPLAMQGDVELPLPAMPASDRILLEALKRAEAGDGWIMRLYEPIGNHGCCTLSVPENTRVWIAGILEDKQEEVTVKDGCAELCFQPFEIKTLLLQPAAK